tara:strand:- start:13486 stop:13656 length:171 start_codon:yes stop_codon:yes gene_type:complete
MTDLERVTASAKKSGRDMTVVTSISGSVVTWHANSPQMIYNHMGKHIETKSVKRGG